MAETSQMMLDWRKGTAELLNCDTFTGQSALNELSFLQNYLDFCVNLAPNMNFREATVPP
jgi:hypothetical protein